MASLMAKTVHGHTYWQIVESQRINGKPRPLVLAHLGKADDLLRRLQQLDRPYTALIRDFGAGSPVGDRPGPRPPCLAPTAYPQAAARSCRGRLPPARGPQPSPPPLPEDATGKVVPRHRPAAPPPHSRQASLQPTLLDHFDYLDAATLHRIEETLSLRLAQRYHLDLKALFYDATNFDTYIDSQTTARLPQRGHAKSHRADLRIVGLALMVSADSTSPCSGSLTPAISPIASPSPRPPTLAAAIGSCSPASTSISPWSSIRATTRRRPQGDGQTPYT